LDSGSVPLRASAVALAGALLLAAALGIGRFAYTPLLPPMQETLGWTVSQSGDVASVNFLGYLLGALAASAFAQRPGRRLWLLVAMILSGITTAAGAVIVSFPAWMEIRFLAGVSSAFCFVLSTAIVVDFLAINCQGQFGALHYSGVGGGIIVSELVIGLTRLAGPLTIFSQWGALGIASLILFAVSWLVIRAVPDQPGLTGGQAVNAAKRRAPTPPLLKRIIAAYGLFGFGYVVTATFIIAMARRLDHSTLVEPLTWIIVGLLAVPSILVWHLLSLRFGIFRMLRVAYGIEAAGVLLAGLPCGNAALVLGGALLGGTFAGITALGLSVARLADETNKARVIGWMTASFGVGQLLGPAVAGRLAQMTQGFGVPSVVAALLLILGIALLWEGENLCPDCNDKYKAESYTEISPQIIV
jgi:MFS family permease